MQESVLNLLTYFEPAACAATLFFLLRARSLKKYAFLALFLSVRLGSTAVCMSIAQLRSTGMDPHFAYKLLFYVYWGSFAVESALSLLIIYSIFRLAMAPLKGLQRLGTLVFRWAGAISAALSMAVTFSSRVTGAKLLPVVVTQMQEVSSVLTLCLLLFVCFAVRPLGLSYRDRIFGVSFGLGIMATASLVDAAWITQNVSMRSDLSLANGVATCLTLLIWSAYFAFPEKKAQMILVPTTSPFLTWNSISEVLGDQPGYVAIGNITPESFAPAEMEMMFRASAKMAELAAGDQQNGSGADPEDDSATHSLIA